MSDDAVFRALADPSRRELLDRLRERNGRTLQDLCQGVTMSRQAVAKHLSVLELADLVSMRWQGREKLHFLNPHPIADAAQGWMGRFKRPQSPLSALSRPEEREGNESPERVAVADQDVRRPPIVPLRALRRSREFDGEGWRDEAFHASRRLDKSTAVPRVASVGAVPSSKRSLRSLRTPVGEDED